MPNHFPDVKVNGSTAKSVLTVQGAANGTIALNANGTTDPDGDNLSYSWFYYKEAGNYSGGITINNSSAKEASVTLPSNFKAGDEVHVILKVADNGNPSLTSYRRIVIKGSTAAPTNNPPTVNITSPVDGSKYDKGANISVAANASDADGSVVKVEFFNGSTLLGTDTSSPYSFSISNAQANSYTLSAKATDNQGTSTTSSTVSITANDAPPSAGDVISSVSSAGNGSYVKGSSFSTGNKYYTDRSYVVTSLPAYLSGAEYIKTANDDKASGNANFLSFTLSRSAEVYVIYDSRATSVPSWLSSYTKKSEQVGTTDVPMDVYVKTLSDGSYTLGGNLSGGASGASSNYFVIAKGTTSSGNTTNALQAFSLPATDPVIAYPVPCADRLYVKNHVPGSAFKVVDTHGLIRMSSVIVENEIDVSKLNPGIYNLDIDGKAIHFIKE